MQNSIDTAAQAKTAIQSLTESVWIYSALYALIAAGAFQHSARYSMQELATQINMPLSVLEQIINLLTQAGFIISANDEIQLASGLKEHIEQIGIERFKASLCISHGLSAVFIESARLKKLLTGWHYTDELILQSQGLYSQYIVTDCFTQVAALQNLLRQPNAVFLDVGAGVGQIALRACEEYLSLKVIALEPADIPYKLAQLNIHTSGYANRIELRKSMLQHIQDDHTVDVAWFPHVFIADEYLAGCLTKLKQALKPSGMLITTALKAKSANQTASVRQLINALYGGLRTSDQVTEALKQAGFSNIETHPEIAGYETITALA